MHWWIGGLLGLAIGVASWSGARWFANPAPAQDAFPAAEGAALSAPAARPHLSRPARAARAALAASGAVAARRLPTPGQALAALLFTGLLLALSLVDWWVRRIPDLLLLALLAWGAAHALWLRSPTPIEAGAGLLVGGGLFLAAALLRRGAMGAGDVKLAAVLGAVLGFPRVLPALLGGALLAAAAALALLLTRRAGRKDYMAYGPFLALGAWLAWTHAAGLWP